MKQPPIYDHHTDEWWTPRDPDESADTGGLVDKLPILLLILLFLLIVFLNG